MNQENETISEEQKEEALSQEQTPVQDEPVPQEQLKEAQLEEGQDEACLEALHEEIEALKAELSAQKDRALRAVAEADNTRRIAQREREKLSKYAAEPLAKDLIEVAENLHRALCAVSEEQAAENEGLRNLRDGVQMVERGLVQAFEKHKIEVIDPKGEDFDPNLHQAMGQIESEDVPTGKVALAMGRAYRLHDRLLRPALVQVAK